MHDTGGCDQREGDRCCRTRPFFGRLHHHASCIVHHARTSLHFRTNQSELLSLTTSPFHAGYWTISRNGWLHCNNHSCGGNRDRTGKENLGDRRKTLPYGKLFSAVGQSEPAFPSSTFFPIPRPLFFFPCPPSVRFFRFGKRQKRLQQRCIKVFGISSRTSRGHPLLKQEEGQHAIFVRIVYTGLRLRCKIEPMLRSYGGSQESNLSAQVIVYFEVIVNILL